MKEPQGHNFVQDESMKDPVCSRQYFYVAGKTKGRCKNLCTHAYRVKSDGRIFYNCSEHELKENSLREKMTAEEGLVYQVMEL